MISLTILTQALEMCLHGCLLQDIPHQDNDYDCGVFMSVAAERLALGQPLNYTEEDMPLLRQKLMLEILQGRIM